MFILKKAHPASSGNGSQGGRDRECRARNYPFVSFFALVTLLLIASSGVVYQSLPVQVGEEGSSGIIEDSLVSVSISVSISVSVSETKNKSAALSSLSNKVQEGDSSSSFSWELPHLLDCHHITTSTDDTNTDANDIFVATKIEPSFLMNIHNPEMDKVSNDIHKDGWLLGMQSHSRNAKCPQQISQFLLSETMSFSKEIYI